MTREEALALLKTHLKNRNLQKHCLAVEAAMAHFAECFHEDEEMWALAGLLHDLDYESTVDNFARHGKDSVEMLKDKGLDEKILYAIEAHPGHVERISNMDKVLYAVDSLTGLIVAAALMHPNKKISSLNTDFILRRFKEKRFAAGANREQIKSFEEFGMSLEDFIEHTLHAMAGIEKELGF
jgi:uncharacterized domain HDIG